MIKGTVDDTGVPIILLVLSDQTQAMIVDTGFNGDLEFPQIVRQKVQPKFLGRVRSILAGGQSIEEDLFAVTIPFDGRTIEAEVTFTPDSIGLIGTRFLRDYRLKIDFRDRSLNLTRVDDLSE